MDAICTSLGGEICSLEVTGPLCERVTARYAVVKEKSLAIIEMAEAAGLTLVQSDKRDPKVTTTYGVGELILHAAMVEKCREFIICIGGSATSDGGVGMLQALGFEFLDELDQPIGRGAVALGRIAKISSESIIKEVRECCFKIACDVDNPLCGELGAAHVFGPQKGADACDVELIDGCLSHYADVTSRTFGTDNRNSAGAGAAGGMGFAFLSYLGGELRSGIELVASATSLEEKIKDADLVITGEGRLDSQSAGGKAPVGVARLAKKYRKICIAFSGCVGKGADKCNKEGIDAYFPIIQASCSLDEAMDAENASENLKKTAKQALLLVRAIQNTAEQN
jgi:glycerate kinase